MKTQPNHTMRGDLDESARRERLAWAWIALAVLLVSLLGVGLSAAQEPQAQDGSSCQAPGRNMHCTAFGVIQMHARHDVRGEPVRIVAEVELHTAYAEQGARWIMFAVRSPATEPDSRLSMSLKAFSTGSGAIVTTRVDQVRPSELNIWVDVMDAPLNTPITLDFEVGAAQRGAYGVEALVIAFDRFYEPLQVDGADASLFSSTLLAVNEETATGGGANRGGAVPGTGVSVALAALLLGAAGSCWRRRA